MLAERDSVRSLRIAHLRVRREDRANDLHVAEHRRGEDVEPCAVAEEELGDVAPAHVRRRAERSLPVAAAPVPGRIRERGVGLQRCPNRVEVTMRVAYEFLDVAHLVASFGLAPAASISRASSWLPRA